MLGAVLDKGICLDALRATLLERTCRLHAKALQRLSIV